jgi:anti-sigma factor RsiW
MADCDDMIPLILGAVEGTLDDPGRARLSAHLEQCSRCVESYEDQRSVRAALGAMTHGPVSPGFAARVRERLAPRPSWLDLTNWRAWTLRLAPVALLLSVLAWWPSGRQATTEVPAGSLSSMVQSWSAGAGSDTVILVDPAADATSLMSAALGEASR